MYTTTIIVLYATLSTISSAAHLSRGRYYIPDTHTPTIFTRSTPNVEPAIPPTPSTPSPLEYLLDYIWRLTERLDAIESLVGLDALPSSTLTSSSLASSVVSGSSSTTYASVSSISPSIVTDRRPSQTPPGSRSVRGSETLSLAAATTYASVSSITPSVITDYPLPSSRVS